MHKLVDLIDSRNPAIYQVLANFDSIYGTTRSYDTDTTLSLSYQLQDAMHRAAYVGDVSLTSLLFLRYTQKATSIQFGSKAFNDPKFHYLDPTIKLWIPQEVYKHPVTDSTSDEDSSHWYTEDCQELSSILYELLLEASIGGHVSILTWIDMFPEAITDLVKKLSKSLDGNNEFSLRILNLPTPEFIKQATKLGYSETFEDLLIFSSCRPEVSALFGLKQLFNDSEYFEAYSKSKLDELYTACLFNRNLSTIPVIAYADFDMFSPRFKEIYVDLLHTFSNDLKSYLLRGPAEISKFLQFSRYLSVPPETPSVSTETLRLFEINCSKYLEELHTDTDALKNFVRNLLYTPELKSSEFFVSLFTPVMLDKVLSFELQSMSEATHRNLEFCLDLLLKCLVSSEHLEKAQRYEDAIINMMYLLIKDNSHSSIIPKIGAIFQTTQLFSETSGIRKLIDRLKDIKIPQSLRETLETCQVVDIPTNAFSREDISRLQKKFYHSERGFELLELSRAGLITTFSDVESLSTTNKTSSLKL